MASIRERRRGDGTRSFAVLWRDPDTGRQTSLTYDTERDATVARKLIEAAGGRVSIVAGDPDNLKVTGPGDLDVLTVLLNRRRVSGGSA